jgi:predicted RNase H-like nuclease
MKWVAGIDGCRDGWIAVLMRVDGAETRHRVVTRLSDIVDGPEAPAVIAVDMPIGLPDRIDGSGRVAEQAVRGLLGQRQSSVFSIPSREAVYAEDYKASCSRAFATSAPSRKVSKQGFMLFSKIREVDALLCARPDLSARIFEVHPEVAFWTMNGEQALAEPKKVKGRPHEPGLTLRRRLLEAEGLPKELVQRAPPRGAGADDYLDALAALVVARAIDLGKGKPFPDPPGRDRHGLPVAIWTYRPEPARTGARRRAHD